jgi:predicted RNase H-like HicB family nuclease
MIGGMKKFVFWGILHKNICIALNENLSKYAQGETFWKAMLNLCETLDEWVPSKGTEESDIDRRLKMYYETGINKVEIFIEEDGKRYTIKCANSRSFLEASGEHDALMKYVQTRAKTSVIDPGLKKME